MQSPTAFVPSFSDLNPPANPVNTAQFNTVQTANTGGGAKHNFIRLIKTKTARWITKSLSPGNDGAKTSSPITKYHRKLLSALWSGDTRMEDVFKHLSGHHLEREGNMAQCVKGMIMILRLLQFGPAGMIDACVKYLDYLDNLTAAWATMQAKAAWGEANDDIRSPVQKRKGSSGRVRRGTVVISKYRNSPEAFLLAARLASLISLKIRFHSRNPDYSPHYNTPPLPRIFLVKSLNSMLDVGANADAVCNACFNVISECMKFNDGLRINEINSGEIPRLEDSSTILGLAIECSYMLAPVLDEGTMIYNACHGVLKNLFNATTTESSDDTSEAAEAHRERKIVMEKCKKKAEAPSRFVYGSESFVSSLYNDETGLQEMWFKTPVTSLEDCCTAMLQLEHGELYAASKRGGGGGGGDNRDFFENNEFRGVFGGSTSSPVRMGELATETTDEDLGQRETFSDLLKQQTSKLEELLNADESDRARFSGNELTRRLSIDKKRVSGEGEEVGEPGLGSPRSPEVLYTTPGSNPLPPPSATRANEDEGRGEVREKRVASEANHALQARLARRGVKGNEAQRSNPGVVQKPFDPFAINDSPPQIERKQSPTPQEQFKAFDDNLATLKAGIGSGDISKSFQHDDVSVDDDVDAEEGEGETERVSSPPTVPETKSVEEQQYHIRYQATHQVWRENMADDVRDLHDLTCSDFQKSDIHLEDFSKIDDFKEIGAGAFACVYRANWSGNVIAVKKLSTQIGQPMTLKTIRDFRTEASLQRALKHENIVQLLAVSTQPLSLIMEFVPRGNLFALLGDNNVSLDWLQRLRIGLGSAKGMAYLHAQYPIIIHRDLKSLNLLLTEDLDCKVTDFGLSRFKAENDDKMTGQCGTYHWMAPEVINSEKYTEKADVYSIAIILWEVYTRAIPYDGMKPVQAAMHVIQGGRLLLPEGTPNWFNHLVCTCWDASPDNRPSMEYVKNILEKAVFAVSNKQKK